MSELWRVIDTSPTSYVLMLAYFLYQLRHMSQRHPPSVLSWQEAGGFGLFLMLGLRRLVWETPEHPFNVLIVLCRAAAFGVIGFSLVGVVGVAWCAVLGILKKIKFQIQYARARKRQIRAQREEMKRREQEQWQRPASPLADGGREIRRKEEKKKRPNKKGNYKFSKHE
ncbi:MAG: hypothetical protein R3C05_09255 [Pirellulaceae bacterium]